MNTTPIDSRRIDLDRPRIAVFGLLILYHAGVFYASPATAAGAPVSRVQADLAPAEEDEAA
jgi:hypothetical protein